MSDDASDRRVLPIPDRPHEGALPLDVRDAEETLDVGADSASPVSDDYAAGSSGFNGTVRWVQIDLDEDAEDADHLISPEERLRIAMARQ